MKLDRLGAEEEGAGCVAVRGAVRDYESDLELLWRKPFGGGGISALRCFAACGELRPGAVDPGSGAELVERREGRAQLLARLYSVTCAAQSFSECEAGAGVLGRGGGRVVAGGGV